MDGEQAKNDLKQVVNGFFEMYASRILTKLEKEKVYKSMCILVKMMAETDKMSNKKIHYK